MKRERADRQPLMRSDPPRDGAFSDGATRWSARSKVAVVLEVLRGEDLHRVSRRYDLAVTELVEWRNRFLDGGEAYLSDTGSHDRVEAPAPRRRAARPQASTSSFLSSEHD